MNIDLLNNIKAQMPCWIKIRSHSKANHHSPHSSHHDNKHYYYYDNDFSANRCEKHVSHAPQPSRIIGSL